MPTKFATVWLTGVIGRASSWRSFSRAPGICRMSTAAWKTVLPSAEVSSNGVVPCISALSSPNVGGNSGGFAEAGPPVASSVPSGAYTAM